MRRTSTTTDPDSPPRRALQTITVERPRCPACSGFHLVKYRSVVDQGDGSALWWVQCRTCDHRFKVLLE